MFLKKRKVNNILYWSIAESFRANGKVKQRIILNLGNTSKARETLKSNSNYGYFLDYVVDPNSIEFSLYNCKIDWSLSTDKNGILIGESIYLTKHQTMEIASACHHIERFRYGYRLFYMYEGRKVSLCMRLLNNTTKKKQTVIEYIENHFDNTAEFHEVARKNIPPLERKLINEKVKEYLSKK